jgi:hypothetical protein
MQSRKTITGNVFFGLLLGVVLLPSFHSPCHAQSYQETKITSEKLRIIKEEILKNRSFPKNSQDFVRHTAISETISSHMAILILSMASDTNLYSKKEIIKILENKLLSIKNTHPELSYVEYISALGFRKATNEQLLNKWISIKEKNKNLNHLDDEEINFISKIIKNKDPQTSVLAGRLAVRKVDLDLKSYRWIQSQIALQIKTSQGPLRDSWILVQRVVATRSPKAASQK